VRFYTASECETWLITQGRQKPGVGAPPAALRIAYPQAPYRINYVAHWIASNLTYRMPALLWVTESGIWSSRENWHLYYRLRQSYADYRLLEEAPGHLFVEHESEDLASFLQVAMQNGWGGYVLTVADYANLFFSHDEFVDLYTEQQSVADELQRAFRRGEN
jgi:hypothetical protein